MKRVTIYIYALKNTKGVPIYVGQSTDPRARLKSHKKRFPNSKLSIIGIAFSRKGALEKESGWVRRYLDDGHPLENINYRLTEQTKRERHLCLKCSKKAHRFGHGHYAIWCTKCREEARARKAARSDFAYKIVTAYERGELVWRKGTKCN